jgi:uncharacterized membrane protein YkvA (DUF1232 family)
VPWWAWTLVAFVVAYALLLAGLAGAGRREHAGALARFVPDCVVLVRRLLGDERLPRRQRALLAGLLAYLALPFDLVPDFIPVAGQLDDAVLVALVLRSIVRAGGPELVREHWPGPPQTLAVVLRAAGAAR